jgi:RNA polymerase sigma-70 factor (ECF subfamily)
LDARDMAQLARGHGPALNQLMDRHAEKLFRYLIRSLQSEEDAADLAQETFVRVYQSRDRFDHRQRFSTWLYAIASNLVRDRFRWRSRHPQTSLDAPNDETGIALGETLPENRPTPDESIQGEERAEMVRRAVASLPEELRLPLILAEYEGRSQADIGEILGCTAKAVETRLYRARQQLRSRLAKWLQAG